MVTRLLLVHSPLVGCATWDLVAADLARCGWEVGVPDLTGTVTAGPPYCVRQAEVIARSASGQPAILIGHSGAGSLLAAAGAIIDQVRGYIFADAGLPTPGQTWMQTVPPELATQLREMADNQGWLPPWPQWWGDGALAELIPDPAARRHFAVGCPRLPLAMFDEVQPPAPQNMASGSRGQPAAKCRWAALRRRLPPAATGHVRRSTASGAAGCTSSNMAS